MDYAQGMASGHNGVVQRHQQTGGHGWLLSPLRCSASSRSLTSICPHRLLSGLASRPGIAGGGASLIPSSRSNSSSSRCSTSIPPSHTCDIWRRCPSMPRPTARPGCACPWRCSSSCWSSRRRPSRVPQARVCGVDCAPMWWMPPVPWPPTRRTTRSVFLSPRASRKAAAFPCPNCWDSWTPPAV